MNAKSELTKQNKLRNQLTTQRHVKTLEIGQTFNLRQDSNQITRKIRKKSNKTNRMPKKHSSTKQD